MVYDFTKIVFLDIETVSEYQQFEELGSSKQQLWSQKCKYFKADRSENTAEIWYSEKAGIFAEYGKIVCVGLGVFDKQMRFRVKAFIGEEKEVLTQALKLIDQYYGDSNVNILCGHNIKEFDFPYICRRALIQNIELPNIFKTHGKKPWELKFLMDTLEMWKFGDAKHYTSLNLLAECLGLPSSKDDIDGSQVGRVFYEEGDINRIAKYCLKDVILTARILQRLLGAEVFGDNQIDIVE